MLITSLRLDRHTILGHTFVSFVMCGIFLAFSSERAILLRYERFRHFFNGFSNFTEFSFGPLADAFNQSGWQMRQQQFELTINI